MDRPARAPLHPNRPRCPGRKGGLKESSCASLRLCFALVSFWGVAAGREETPPVRPRLRPSTGGSRLASQLRLPTPAVAEPIGEDRLLTPIEAAERLGVSSRWLYRHAGSLPFTRRLSRKVLRFSEAGLNRYLDGRKLG